MTKQNKYGIIVLVIGVAVFVYPKQAMSRTWSANRISYDSPKVAFLYGVDMKICKVDGCGVKYKSLGYCLKHYSRYKRYGSPEIVKIVKGVHVGCLVKECNKKHHSHGYCSKHYSRVQKYGSPHVVKFPRIHTKCTISGCLEKHEAKGLCKKHYYIENKLKQSKNGKKID